MLYNGFISYSHAADGNLAPAVQSALHRFARPWYRLRSVWIFRDKTGLAVTPTLWETIKKALADCEYFLLMASPESAASLWVQKEVDWWLTNRAPSNMLLLLTDGEIEWNSSANDFDWSHTTALPPNLRGRMAQEPLWVDLRWARTEEKLSLRHSRFRGAILDIASTLLNRPKESLDSEDVRVYKRNRVAAYSAVLVSLLLAIGATTAAVIANRERVIAQNEARIATSGRLAATAVLHKGDQLDLASLLSVEAGVQVRRADLYSAFGVQRNSRAFTLESTLEERFSATGRRGRFAGNSGQTQGFLARYARYFSDEYRLTGGEGGIRTCDTYRSPPTTYVFPLACREPVSHRARKSRAPRPQKSLVFRHMPLFLEWQAHCINQRKTPLGRTPHV